LMFILVHRVDFMMDGATGAKAIDEASQEWLTTLARSPNPNVRLRRR
jgi:hypothetical protein